MTAPTNARRPRVPNDSRASRTCVPSAARMATVQPTKIPKRASARNPCSEDTCPSRTRYTVPFRPNESWTTTNVVAAYNSTMRRRGCPMAATPEQESDQSWEQPQFGCPPRVGRPSPDPIERRRGEIADRLRAVAGDLIGWSRPQGSSGLEIRPGVRKGECQRQRPSAEQRRNEALHGNVALERQQQRHEDDQRKPQEDAVIDTTQKLQPDEQPRQQPVSPPARLHRPVHCPQRERNEHRPLQFEVHHVLDPVRQDREDGSRHQ